MQLFIPAIARNAGTPPIFLNFSKQDIFLKLKIIKMKKIIIAVAAICFLSVASLANDGGKNKSGKHAVKKEQKVSKKMDCPATCPRVGCNRS